MGGVLKNFRQAGAELDVKLKEEEIFLIVPYDLQGRLKNRTHLLDGNISLQNNLVSVN